MSASDVVNSYLDLPAISGTVGMFRNIRKTKFKAFLKRKAHRRVRKMIKHCLKVLDDKQSNRGHRATSWDID